MPAYQFILAMVLASYVGFSRLHHMRFLQREPMLTESWGVAAPPQFTFWRFLASLHGGVTANCWKCSGACDSDYGKRPT